MYTNVFDSEHVKSNVKLHSFRKVILTKQKSTEIYTALGSDQFSVCVCVFVFFFLKITMYCFTLFTQRAARKSFADSNHNMPQLRQLQSLNETSRNMFSKVKGTL